MYVVFITGYNADVVCLQEVDRKVYEQDLLPNFSELGFCGLLSLKTGDVAEGTATFFRCSKFRLVGTTMCIYERCSHSSR